MAGMTLFRVLSLGAVDAINPCALAVLTLVLVSVFTYDPEDRKNVLFTGLAFALTVYVTYFFYGLVMVKFFQAVQMISGIKVILYRGLGVVAILLGALQVKDFFFYSPGTVTTEMPKSIRPKVKKLVKGVTSPLGVIPVAVFVTVFLLPCTIGPYLIATGSLSTTMEFLKTVPWLLLYNLVFILPMLAITLVVYAGITTVKEVSEWKGENIERLHLLAGLIMISIGLLLFLGPA